MGSRKDGEYPLLYRHPSSAGYRAAQEGLNNVAKHAQATQAEIKLHQSPRAITCSVVDDGKGFDLTTLSARDGRRGLGLVEIRERMVALGGTLRVGSSVDLGTEFTVEIPLEAPAWA
jgi:signal transduction histidine kinase